MAQPLQYQSQFVPTDFNTVGNILGMFRQDMGQRNQEFDQGAAMEVQSLADLGALDAFDQEGKKQRIDSISKLMQEAVTKHGGDYGAASKDIARIIASERANPWYQFNKEQQEALKNYNQLKLNADNVIIGDPRVKYQDYQRGMAEGNNPFQVSALSKTNLYNQVSKIASNFADRLESDPKFKSTLGGQYFQAMKNYGISPENFEAFINTGEGANIMKSVLAANPELQGANVDTVKEIVKQGLYSAIGKSDSQYLANQGYISPYDAYRMQGEKQSGYYPDVVSQTGFGLVPTSLGDLESRVFKPRADKLAIEKAKQLGIAGVSSFEDLKNMAIPTQSMIRPEALATMTPEQQKQWKERTTQSPQSKLAQQALSDIEGSIKSGGEGLALPTYNFNTLVAPSGKSITEVSKLEEGFVNQIKNNKSRFTGITKEDKKNFEKITDNMMITDISNDFQRDKTGLFLYVSGFDKDKNPVTARVELNPTETMLEDRLMSFIRPLSKKLDNEYRYAKNPDAVLKEAREDLAEAERIGDTQVAETIRRFIDIKTKK